MSRRAARTRKAPSAKPSAPCSWPRTARGTLDEEGMLKLDEDTLKLTPGLLMSIECARLRAGLGHWTEYARRVVNVSGKLVDSEIIHELQTVADGLNAVLATAAPEEES